jgi:hypothetical protein
MRIAVVRLITFWGRSASIVAFLRLTITVVALVVVVVGFGRGSIAGRRRIGVRGGRHIITICGRVVRIGHRIPVSPVIMLPVADVPNRAYRLFLTLTGRLRSQVPYLSTQHPQSLRY